MDLGEWGTFLGGIFGPVAFLWLILGYLQQRDELHLNTEALHLQQHELKRQVDETARLVQHAEAQSRATLDLLNLERDRQDAEKKMHRAKSKIALRFVRGTHTGASGELLFENAGGRARFLTLGEPSPGGSFTLNPTDVLQTGAKGQVIYSNAGSMPVRMTLSYTDDNEDRRGVILEIGPGSLLKQLDGPEPEL
jgi:hypothetical protein